MMMNADGDIKQQYALTILARIIARRYLADLAGFQHTHNSDDEQENEEAREDQHRDKNVS
jgi:hypothetical protein